MYGWDLAKKLRQTIEISEQVRGDYNTLKWLTNFKIGCLEVCLHVHFEEEINKIMKERFRVSEYCWIIQQDPLPGE